MEADFQRLVGGLGSTSEGPFQLPLTSLCNFQSTAVDMKISDPVGSFKAELLDKVFLLANA